MEIRFPNGAALKLIQGDITRIPADVIVNAANSALAGGGGVDGAIHRAGGPSIMQELDAIRDAEGGCATGSAVVTGPGNLPAKWIFHAVGPVYRDGRQGEAKLLESCYAVCMQMAEERQAVSISFPAISTGAFGYPLDDAAEIAVATVSAYLERGGSVRDAVLVVFGTAAFRQYSRALELRG